MRCARSNALSALCADGGQMVVELAVLVPVVIVVSLTVFNLMRFMEVCARFDRIALDAVISQGVAPEGEQSELSAVSAIESCIEDALGSHRCSVRVEAQPARSLSRPSRGLSFPVSPLLTSFRCTLTYQPWPGSFIIAGMVYASPFELTHVRTIVVDRYRPGVVV